MYDEILHGRERQDSGHNFLNEHGSKIQPLFEKFVNGRGSAKNFLEFRDQMCHMIQLEGLAKLATGKSGDERADDKLIDTRV